MMAATYLFRWGCGTCGFFWCQVLVCAEGDVIVRVCAVEKGYGRCVGARDEILGVRL